MNKFVLLTSAVALATVSSVAGAVTIKNTDKAEATINLDAQGQKQVLKLKENQSFDSQGKDVSFSLGANAPTLAKGNESYSIKNGKAELNTTATAPVAAQVEPVAPKTEAPSAGGMQIEPKLEQKAPLSVKTDTTVKTETK